MGLRDALLSVANSVRQIPQALDLRQCTVTMRVRTWSGDIAGTGVKTDVDTRLYAASGTNPKVRELSNREIVASGGKYQDQDVKVGPITPAFAGGGVASAFFDPPVVRDRGREIFYLVTGPGMATDGTWFSAVSSGTDMNFHYELILRRLGADP